MILVTGGTGLVGAHLLYKLVDEQQKVRAIYRSTDSLAKAKKIFGFYSDKPNEVFDKIEWFKADILNIEELEDAFLGCSTIYHCAAMVSFHPKDAHKMYQINVHGTQNLVNVALANPSPIDCFCFVSSTAAVGSDKLGGETTEKNTWEIKNAGNYAVSKKRAELEVWRGSEEGLNVVIVNPSIILGPGNWEEGSANIFKKIHQKLKYHTPGTNGFVGVQDVVNAMTTLVNQKIYNERFLVVSENWSFKKLFTTIAKELNAPLPYVEAKKWQTKLLVVIEKIKTFLFNTYPLITKETAINAFSKIRYSNQKIKQQASFSFTPINEVINTTCKYFNKEH